MLMHRLVAEGAARHPDKVALRWIDRGRSLSYAQAVEQMERMAGLLTALGASRGDRVTIFAHNGLDYLTTMLGCWRIGAIAALVNVKYARELAYYLADHLPALVVYTHDMGDAVRAACATLPGPQPRLVCMDGAQPGAESLPDLLQAALPPPADPMDENAIAHLSYTSGTTGQPKGACLAHEPTVRAARCIGERLRIRSDDQSFGPTALSSSYQLVANLLPALAAGATVNVMGHWTPASGYEAMARVGATLLVGNPSVLNELLQESRARGAPPSGLRCGLSGGGAVPPTLKSAWRDELRLPLVESFGQSELGGFFALGYPELEPRDDKLQRVGRMLPDKEVRIATTDDGTAAVGEVGEIVMRGGFMHGYWGRPVATQQATRGGWLRSGDLGLMDEEGFITMRARRAELLRVDGTDWFPRDVEEALCAQPGVSLAALVGVPAAAGTLPVAFVTLLPNASVDPLALKQAIHGAVPHDIGALTVRLVAELPMTPTGKVSKAQLVEAAKREASP